MARDVGRPRVLEWGYEHVVSDMLDLDEAEYELRIRGISGLTSSSETRRLTRSALNSRNNPDSSVLNEEIVKLDPESEYIACSDKLEILRHDLLDSPGDLHSRRRLKSRLITLGLRVLRNSNHDFEGSDRFERLLDSIEAMTRETLLAA